MNGVVNLKGFEELSPAERKSFATDTLLVNSDFMYHSRLGITVTVETFDRVHEWYRDQPRRSFWQR